MGFFHNLIFGYTPLPDSHGSATFATPSEEKHILQKKNQGIYVTHEKRLSRQASCQHVLMLAPSGAGKTTRFILPNALGTYSLDNSFVYLDPSGEIYKASAAWLKRQGWEVQKIDLQTPSTSKKVNPIMYAQKGKHEQQMLAQWIIQATYGQESKDTFWNEAALSLIRLLLALVIQQEIQHQTLHYLASLLNRIGTPKEEELKALAQNDLDDTDFQMFCSFISHDDKMKLSIVETAKVALRLYTDPILQQITQGYNLDFAHLRSTPTVLFVIIPEHKGHFYAPFILVLFSLLFEQLIESDQGLPITFFLDEFGQYAFPNYPQIITTIRKRNIAVNHVIQSYEQLEASYGRVGARIIFENCSTKVFLSGLSYHSAKMVSDMLGTKTELYTKDISNNDTEQRVARLLLTPEEVRTIPKDKAILLHGNEKPIQLIMKPFYNVRKLIKRKQLKSG